MAGEERWKTLAENAIAFVERDVLQSYHREGQFEDSGLSANYMTFIAMYRAGRGELYLAKAKALTDSITRVQRENGMIPTHWMDERTLNGHNFWVNCMIASADAAAAMAELTETV